MERCEFCKEEEKDLDKPFEICEYCGKMFCSRHIYWENHFCEKNVRELTDEELNAEIQNAEDGIQTIEKDLKTPEITSIDDHNYSIKTLFLADKQIQELKRNIELYKKELNRRKEKL
jgi:hypothetical protein